MGFSGFKLHLVVGLAILTISCIFLLNRDQTPTPEEPIDPYKVILEGKVALEPVDNGELKRLEKYGRFFKGNARMASKVLSLVQNKAEFLFFLVFYNEAEEVFLVNNTQFYKYVQPSLPLTRFIQDDQYCFHNFLYVMYHDPSFIGVDVGFEYTFTNTTKEFLNASFGGNIWPEPYNKRKTKSEDARKNKRGFNLAKDIELYRKPIYTLDPKIKAFYTSTYWHTNHAIGKQFSCMFQISNHLPGHKYLALKNNFVTASREYAKIYEGKEKCFDPKSLVPKSWLLKEEQECLEFFEIISEPGYQEELRENGPKYIRKIAAGSHRGKGVEVVDQKEEAELRTIYENGNKCGKVDKNYMIQEYIQNPLTVDGHKFDFRVYLNIISTDPFIVMFHDGFLKVSLFEYDPLSTNKASHITSSEISKEIFKKVEQGDQSFNMTVEELRDYQLWTFTRFHEHLMSVGKVSDPNWIDNFLRPAFRRAMIHVAQMNFKYLVKNPTIYEMFGVDFMFDDQFNLWFLECNSNPELIPTNEFKEIFFHTLVKENIDISLSFLRSRAKRILAFINELKEEVLRGAEELEWRSPELALELIESRIKERNIKEKLRSISKNKLDEKLGIPEGNTYQWVLDFSQISEKPEMVYKGLIDADCVPELNELERVSSQEEEEETGDDND